MNHSITIGGLLLSLGVLGGIVMLGFGALMAFAGGMSDAGDDGTSSTGCITALAGALLVIVCLVVLFI